MTYKKEKTLTAQFILLRSLVRDGRQTGKILYKTDLIVVVSINDSEDAVKQRRVLEEHGSLELSVSPVRSARSKKYILTFDL